MIAEPVETPQNGVLTKAERSVIAAVASAVAPEVPPVISWSGSSLVLSADVDFNYDTTVDGPLVNDAADVLTNSVQATWSSLTGTVSGERDGSGGVEDGIPEQALARLAEGARIRSYRKNSYLYSTGEQGSEVYCLLAGRVRLLMTSAIGQEYAVTDCEAGTWLGGEFLSGDNPARLDVQINKALTVLTIPRTLVLEIANEHPQVFKALFSDYMSRFAGLMVLLQGMAFYPLRSRLAGWLLELLENCVCRLRLHTAGCERNNALASLIDEVVRLLAQKSTRSGICKNALERLVAVVVRFPA